MTKTKAVKSGSAKGAKSKNVVTDVQVTVGLPTKNSAVHPAMHFDRDSGIAYFGFSLPVTTETVSEGEKSQAETPCLVTDKGLTIPCLASELRQHNITLATEPEWSSSTQNRISNDLLMAIMNGNKKTKRGLVLSVPELFKAGVTNNAELVYLPDTRWHEYLALWTFGTYVFPIFDTYPQILLWGPRVSPLGAAELRKRG